MSTTWVVTSWNLLGSERPDITAVAAHLRSFAPDVVALQEVRRAQARRLGRVLGWRVAWRRKHYPYSPAVWWRAEGLALLTPHALDRVERHTLSVGHPIWVWRHRVMVSGVVTRTAAAGGGALAVHDVHLSSDHRDERVDQARRATAFALGGRGAEVAMHVLCGDLNANDEPAVVDATAPLGVRDPGGPFTVKADRPVKRLDYVLVPVAARDVEVTTPQGGADWRALSDHLPVTTRFTI
ncbi:MAG: endonuclease/exonuclease/phosphatase family protein [Ilumatobacteraceae bacterium]